MASAIDVLKIFNTLPMTEKAIVLNSLYSSKLESGDDDIHRASENIRFANGRYCPCCQGTRIKRNGHTSYNAQRFICNGCKKSFVSTTNTIFFASHKNLDTWKRFIDCFMDGMSVEKTAEKCGISARTAFRWRHKVLDMLINMENEVTLERIVEADEAFFDISYKGNHKKDAFKIPRKSHKRGGESHKRGLSKDKVNVPCAMNRRGLSIGMVSSLGKSSFDTITKVFDGKIKENSILCTDSEKSYSKLAIDNKRKRVAIKSGRGSKGIYNIQRINSYHSQLKRFINHFNGVSTKYLNNYIAWHNFVNIAPEGYIEKHNVLLNYLFTDSVAVKCEDIPKRNPLPLLTQN